MFVDDTGVKRFEQSTESALSKCFQICRYGKFQRPLLRPFLPLDRTNTNGNKWGVSRLAAIAFLEVLLRSKQAFEWKFHSLSKSGYSLIINVA